VPAGIVKLISDVDEPVPDALPVVVLSENTIRAYPVELLTVIVPDVGRVVEKRKQPVPTGRNTRSASIKPLPIADTISSFVFVDAARNALVSDTPYKLRRISFLRA
jgi:hypothetical protein